MTKPSFMEVVVNVVINIVNDAVNNIVVNKLVATFDGSALHSAGVSIAESFPHLWATYTPQGRTCPENPNTNLQSSLISCISSPVVQRFWV